MTTQTAPGKPLWDELRVALRHANLTATELAVQLGVTWHHLYYVVKLGRQSDKLMAKVRAFIDQQEEGKTTNGQPQEPPTTGRHEHLSSHHP